MDEAAVRNQLNELRDILTKTPSRDPVAMASMEGLCLAHRAAGEPSLEECLDYLRVLTKYVAFDLEATRRENRYLRQMLETRPHRDRDEDQDDGSS